MHNDIRTVFMDLDNTIYDHITQTVPQKHMEALQALKNKGYKVCICTGRPYMLVQDIHLESLIDWDGYICGNGSYVYDKDRVPLLEEPISQSDTKRIVEYADSMNLGILGFGNVRMATKDDIRVRTMINAMHFSDVDIRPLKDTDAFSNILIKPDDPMKKDLVLESLAGIDIVYMDQWLEIKRAHNSKFQGIKVLMDRFQEPVHNYLAFGDSAIDFEMLENASVAVMVANGDYRLKHISGIQMAPSCHDGGVYTWLKENGWI